MTLEEKVQATLLKFKLLNLEVASVDGNIITIVKYGEARVFEFCYVLFDVNTYKFIDEELLEVKISDKFITAKRRDKVARFYSYESTYVALKNNPGQSLFDDINVNYPVRVYDSYDYKDYNLDVLLFEERGDIFYRFVTVGSNGKKVWFYPVSTYNKVGYPLVTKEHIEVRLVKDDKDNRYYICKMVDNKVEAKLGYLDNDYNVICLDNGDNAIRIEVDTR